MRGILVDPYLEQISEIEYDGQWQSIGRLLGIAESPFTMIRLGDVEDHHMYLDDEGLYKPQQRFFLLLGAAAPLAGRGLILRETDSGAEAPAIVPLGVVQNSIRFLPKSVRFTGTTTREGVINHPTFGRTTVIENTPHFIDTKRRTDMSELDKNLQEGINHFLAEANAVKDALQQAYDELEAKQEERENEARSSKMDELQEKIDTLDAAIDAVEAIE